MTVTLNNMTYDALVIEAQARSQKGNCWVAVVDVTVYRTGKTFTTLAQSSAGMLKNKANRYEFRGVAAQFYCGQPVA